MESEVTSKGGYLRASWTEMEGMTWTETWGVISIGIAMEGRTHRRRREPSRVVFMSDDDKGR